MSQLHVSITARCGGLSTHYGNAMTEDVTLPVQRQLEAYNAKDLSAFVACYHSDISI